MLLYLVRHGLTASNSGVIYAGRTNEPVSAEAGQAIETMTNFLLTCDISRIYSSPLLRTRQTAEPLALHLKLPVETVSELTEMDVGPWAGLTGIEISAAFSKEWATWRQTPFNMSLQGFEDLPSVQKRALTWLCSLPVHASPAAVFSHEAVIKVVLCALSGDSTRYRDLVVNNCSVQLIESYQFGKRVEWTLRAENLFAPG